MYCLVNLEKQDKRSSCIQRLKEFMWSKTAKGNQTISKMWTSVYEKREKRNSLHPSRTDPMYRDVYRLNHLLGGAHTPSYYVLYSKTPYNAN